jgi:sugar lactone lactonase YvrE
MKKIVLFFTIILLYSGISAQIIKTVAGGGPWPFEGQKALLSQMAPGSIVEDPIGNIYYSENSTIRKISKQGIVTTIAGTGTIGYSGDGGLAIKAMLYYPSSLILDPQGNLCFSDALNNRVRRISKSGIISTIAGNGLAGFSGDGGLASAAQIGGYTSLIFDKIGNLYIEDFNNYRIRKVSVDGIISTYAGNGNWGNDGDGGQAINASIVGTGSMAFAPDGTLYIPTQASTIRAISPIGIINTVVGNGISGFSGDGGMASAAQLNYPMGVSIDKIGNMFVLDGWNYRIRKISTSGIITTVAGNGTYGYSGDGGPATMAQISYTSLYIDNFGNIIFADTYHSRIREINLSGIISTIGGTGAINFTGDGGNPLLAQFNGLSGLTFDGLGNLFIMDQYNYRIRKVSTNNIVTTYAGNGSQTYNGDGMQATLTAINPGGASGIAADKLGNVFFSEPAFNRVRKITTDGIITTIAGNGTYGFSGDGGPAISAQVGYPQGITIDKLGNLFFVDGNRIRKISTDGIINTVAGNGNDGYGKDGVSALNTEVYFAQGIYVDELGNLFIAESGSNRIRMVNNSGIISTYAGFNSYGLSNNYGFSGDGGQATIAKLNFPVGVSGDKEGNIYIADIGNNRIRKVDPNGIINTIAGNGTYGFSGDGGIAINASLNYSTQTAIDLNGNVLFADMANNRVRGIYNSVISAITTGLSLKTYYTKASQPKKLIVGGTNLISNVTITGNSNIEFSKDPDRGYVSSISLNPTNLTLNNTSIYFRLTSIVPVGIYNDQISVTASGLPTKTFNLVDTVLKKSTNSSFEIASNENINLLDATESSDVSISAVVTAYPNPTRGQFQLTINNFNTGKAGINIIDAKGSTIKSKDVQITTRKHVEHIDLSSATNGSYFIQVFQNNQMKSIPIIKE